MRIPQFAVLVPMAALVLSAAAPATAAGSAPVGATKQLSVQHPSTTKTFVSPVASTTNTSAFGSRWAVFQRRNVLGTTPDQTGRLLAVTAQGHTYDIGQITVDMRDFSLSGYTLTATSSTRASRVYWWQPSSNAGTTFNVGMVTTGHQYLSSAPDGWVEIDTAGNLYDVPAANPSSARPLGNPFGTAQGVGGVSGPTGIVAWNATKVSFVSFATGAVTPLDVSRLTNLPGGTNTPVCWSVSASAVACGSYYFTGEDNSGIRNVFLDPLDGAPAFAVTTKDPQAATMLGSHAAWLTEAGKLQVLGKGTLVIAATKVGAWPVAGLGGFLTTDPKRHVGTRISVSTKQTSTVLPATYAKTEATAFALTSGSAIWLRSTSTGATVERRTVARNSFHTGVTTGPIQTLGPSTALRGELAADGHTVAYPTDLNNSAVGQNGGQKLRVVTPTGTATIDGVDRYLPISLGDHRVAYYTDSRNAALYNLKTRKTAKFAVSGFALNGHWLAYADQGGTIRLKDLTSGTVRTVATGVQIPDGQLFVHGQVVAWNTYPPGAGGHLGYYRDMAGSAAAVQLPTTVNVWQLSDAGLVLEHTTSVAGSSSPSFPRDRAVRFHAGMTFLLQPYGASTSSTLLVTDYPVAGPQVAGNVVAWIDQHGNLKARALE